MKKTCVIFGGTSVEHDVSVLTAKQLTEKTKNSFDLVKIYLSKSNRFFVLPKGEIDLRLSDKNFGGREVFLHQNSVYSFSVIRKKLFDIDTVVNCCHGGVGEDGKLSGLLDFQNIKVTSANCLSASIGMDKFLTKKIVGDLVPVVDGVLLNSEEELMQKENEIMSLGESLIVKPNSLGSSIGVGVCDTKNYQEFVRTIFALGDSALIEKRVENLVEYNQACFRDGEKIVLSEIEQPLSKSAILSFDDKYKAGSKTKGRDRIIPAKITKELKTKISDMTKLVYNALNLNGVVRIDYLFDAESKDIYFNEVNTVPGSLAYYLFEPMGIDYITLVEKLIQNAKIKKYQYLDTGLLKKN